MSKPNILYVFCDQLRRQSLGFVGEEDVITPNIDSFCKESVVFQNSISNYPVCSPHRASLLTGLYPHNANVATNCRTGMPFAGITGNEYGVGSVCKDNGYQTAYVGKWHVNELGLYYDNNNILNNVVGWNKYPEPGKMRLGFDYWYVLTGGNNHLDPEYWDNTETIVSPHEWGVKHETEKAIEWLDTTWDKDNPFCMVVSYNPPHNPFHLVPDEYLDMYDHPIKLRKNVSDSVENLDLLNQIDMGTTKGFNLSKEQIIQKTKEYYAAITGIDDYFGQLLTYLDQHNLSENTIVVFSSDHGESLGSNGIWHKNTWLRESCEIPFIIRYPEKLAPSVEDNIISSVDHFPTIFELAGIKTPEEYEGSNKLATVDEDDNYGVVMRVSPTINADIMSLIGQSKEQVEAYLKDYKEHAFDLFKKSGYRAYRDKRYTFVVVNYFDSQNIMYGSDKSFTNKIQLEILYDHKIDPYELHPITTFTEEQRNLCNHFTDKLKTWSQQTNDCFEYFN